MPADLFEAAWPFNTDSPHAQAVLSEHKFLSVMLVDVTGLGWDEIAPHLQSVRDIAATKQLVPVFVVDIVDYRDLIEENLVYDTLPNLAANAPLSPELDWTRYLDVRRALLRDKWRPAAVINLGTGGEWDAP